MHPSVTSFLRGVFPALLALPFLPLTAHAGTWQARANDPVYSCTASPPGNVALPPGTGPNQHPSTVTGGGASLSITGTASFQWTWVPAYPSEPPPLNVIMTENVSTGMIYYGGSGVLSPPGTTKYEVKDSSSGTVSLSVPVGAAVTFSGGSGGGLLFVYANASPVSVLVTLGGTNSPFAGDYRALTGQQIKATLNGIPSDPPNGFKVTKYTWSIAPSATVFKTYDPTLASNQLVALGSTDLAGPASGSTTVAPLAFYDRAAENLTVTCAVTVTAPDGTTLSLTATSPQINVLKPTATWTVNMTYNNYPPGFFINYSTQKFGAQQLWGPIVISEPSGFAQNGTGTGCIIQVATLDRSVARTPLNGKPAIYNKRQVTYGDGTTGMIAAPTGLDASFPYPFGHKPNPDGTFTDINSKYTWAANTKGYSGDTPTSSFVAQDQDNGGNQWYSSTANDRFNTWVMYCPPANGLGTIYVPLQILKWSWGGNASLTGGVWSVSQGPPFTPGTPADTTVPPSWNLTIPYNAPIGP